MKDIVAVFDLEGTMFKRSDSFMREIRDSRVQGIAGIARLVIFNISLLMVFTLYKIHLINELAMRTTIINRIAALLKGSEEKRIHKRARVFAAKYLNLLRPEIGKVLKNHKKNGHTTILFSGMIQPYIEAIRRELGIDIAVGTEREVQDGYYTGRLAGVPCLGERRAQMLSEITARLDNKINLDDSFAYGDAIFDRFFMDMVGNPVAIHPDDKLAKYAKEYGWRVIV